VGIGPVNWFDMLKQTAAMPAAESIVDDMI
jgi:hypothetical protein